ncbi:hypothetical protein JCM6882_009276 [Rhodosporidiobolus microsporus]
MTRTEPVEGLVETPAPWNLTGKAWIFPTYTPFSEAPVAPPEGSYAPLEQGSKADQSERFHGGVGTVMLIRYDSGEAGPYDELLLVPGLFSRTKTGNDKPDYHFSISRIYVSTDVSVYNGRKNWGIPKHRALFDWSTSPSGNTLLSISHPSSPSHPFFRAELANSPLTPFSVPASTSMLDWRLSKWLMDGYSAALYQPALTGATESADEGKVESVKRTGQDLEAVVGSAHTFALKPEATGWARIACILPVKAEDGQDWSAFGDGLGFPRFTPAKEGPLKGRGVHMPSFKMSFPVSTIVQE